MTDKDRFPVVNRSDPPAGDGRVLLTVGVNDPALADALWDGTAHFEIAGAPKPPEVVVHIDVAAMIAATSDRLPSAARDILTAVLREILSPSTDIEAT